MQELSKKLMSNSPFRSDDTTGQLLVESEQGQATPQENRTQPITSVNLVIGQGQSLSSTTPSEANRQLDYKFDRVDTASDPSLS